jgi:hypothetical protein
VFAGHAGATLALARVAMVLVLAGAAAACALPPACAPGEQRSVSELLYFGTDRPGGRVSAEDWSAFLRTAVTPRFPKGFTAWPASGQWRNADGKIVQEPTFVLGVVHPDDAASDQAVRAIAGEYKARFQQESVLRLRNHACSSF